MKKLKLIHQSSMNECGLCCMAMISSYYGKTRLVSYYREKFKIGRDGISIYDMVNLLKEDQFDVSVLKIDLEDLEPKFIKKNPLIIFLSHNHYVVLKKIKKDIFTLLDPAKGEIQLSKNDFSKLFGGYVVHAIPHEPFTTKIEKESEFRYIFEIVKK